MQKGVDRDTAFGVWVSRWMHWGGCGAVLRSDGMRYADMLFKRRVEESKIRGEDLFDKESVLLTVK